MANGKHANGISSFTISNRALYLHVLENLPCKVFDDLVFCNLKTMMTLAQERSGLAWGLTGDRQEHQGTLG